MEVARPLPGSQTADSLTALTCSGGHGLDWAMPRSRLGKDRGAISEVASLTLWFDDLNGQVSYQGGTGLGTGLGAVLACPELPLDYLCEALNLAV